MSIGGFARFEVFDDDGKACKDKKDDLIGEGFFSLKQLEAALRNQSLLQLGHKGKVVGKLQVRSFRTLEPSSSTGSSAPGSRQPTPATRARSGGGSGSEEEKRAHRASLPASTGQPSRRSGHQQYRLHKQSRT